MSDDVGAFFDRHADEYHRGEHSGSMMPFHRQSARKIEASLSGTVVCVGGLWAAHDPAVLEANEVIVFDVSEQMLAEYKGRPVDARVGDARDLPLADRSVDHVILPLVLHHITSNGSKANGSIARREAIRAIEEAHRVLKPGGVLWVSEFTVRPALYAVEVAASTVTGRLLNIAGIPLVVMHSAGFYRTALEKAGFRDVTMERLTGENVSWSDWVQPVIGLPWLRIPRGLYPISAQLICATRHG